MNNHAPQKEKSHSGLLRVDLARDETVVDITAARKSTTVAKPGMVISKKK